MTEGSIVDGVNGVDLFLPRQDLGRMNTDLEDTVNNETYTCLGTCVKLKDKSHMKAPIMLYTNICPSLKSDLEHGVILYFILTL